MNKFISAAYCFGKFYDNLKEFTCLSEGIPRVLLEAASASRLISSFVFHR